MEKKITLSIDCSKYPLRINEEDEELYRDIEYLVNSKIKIYQERYPDLEEKQHLIMVLLDLGYKYLNLKEQKKSK